MKRAAIITMFLSVLAGRAWGASPGDWQAFAEKNGYAPADVAAFDKLIAGAAAKGLAPKPLTDKAQEGIAKRIPAKMLLGVLRKMTERMQTVQQAVPPSLRTTAVLQAADLALAAGYSLNGVRTVAEAGAAKAEPYRVQAAFYALGVLRDAGATEQGAVPFVSAQLHAGLNAAEIDDTTRTGARALRAGLIDNAELGRTSPGDLKGANRTEWRNLMNGVQSGRPGSPPWQVRGVIERRDAESRTEKLNGSRSGVAPPAVTPQPIPGIGDNSGGHDEVEDIDDHESDSGDNELSSDRKK